MIPFRVKPFSNSAVVSDVSINYKVGESHASVALKGIKMRETAVVDFNHIPIPQNPVKENPLVADTVTGVVLVDVAMIMSVCVALTNFIVTLTV